MAGGAQAKMSTWFSKPNQSLISKVKHGVIPVVSQTLVKNQGDFVLMRTCLHTMVMFVNNNTEEEVEHLKEMAKYDIFRPAVVSLRSGEYG